MARLSLHWLLALTLILNGISAPWAMARMGHAGHGATAHHTHQSVEQAATPAGDHADLQAHGHGAHLSDGEQMPASPDDGSCCDGTSCQCGCVLPPALSLALAAVPEHVLAATAQAVPPARLLPHHDAPPLRPPAA